jgi:hypothetical protein
MIEITNILPQYGKLNKIYRIVLNRHELLYNEQCFISDFYSDFCDTEKSETMIINVIHELEIEKSSVILKSLQVEIENNILLYDKNQSFWKNIDTGNICRTYSKKGQHLIEEQYKIHKEHDRNLKLAISALEAFSMTQSLEQEKDQLWNEHDYQKSLYEPEQEKLFNLQKAQVELEKETLKCINNNFEKISELNNSLLSILNKYINHITNPTAILKKGENPYFNTVFVYELWKLTNDKQFKKISESEFYNAINLLTKPIALEIKKGEIYRVCYLIRTLFKHIKNEQKSYWKSEICKHLKIEKGFDKRPSAVKDQANSGNHKQKEFITDIEVILVKSGINP